MQVLCLLFFTSLEQPDTLLVRFIELMYDDPRRLLPFCLFSLFLLFPLLLHVQNAFVDLMGYNVRMFGVHIKNKDLTRSSALTFTFPLHLLEPKEPIFLGRTEEEREGLIRRVFDVYRC